jgi:hypothetical protein
VNQAERFRETNEESVRIRRSQQINRTHVQLEHERQLNAELVDKLARAHVEIAELRHRELKLREAHKATCAAAPSMADMGDIAYCKGWQDACAHFGQQLLEGEA